MHSQLTSIVLGNTTVKLTGKNGLDTLRTIALETEASLEDLQNLKQGEFFLKMEQSRSFPVKVHRHLVENRRQYEITGEQWNRLIADQIQRYYRSTAVDERKPEPPKTGSKATKYQL